MSHDTCISDSQDTAAVEPTTSPPHKNKQLFGFMDNAPPIPYVNTVTAEADIQDYLSTPCILVGSEALQY